MSKPFTFLFPMKLDSGGAIARDETSRSQLNMLAGTQTGQRIDDVGYGFPPHSFEQETLADESSRPIALVLTQQAITEYIPTMLLSSIDVAREPASRKLGIEIEYMERSRFEDLSSERLGLGLDIDE
ncbi:MAG TPA: hypothetical protein DCE42_19390 [Myxococcales bacterium]|nr:hypothetical protein [Deltaproteobacteria bacterium]MBU53495.1 hypothetical protein [Deltaproteobacteria bacterium]HAA56939.1 hypothetical protein [Myxococcales bacterium]|tara:strand:- start:18796 stop:19176 length:381 start_codon:yes stop_codon:yes gene_type:complete